MTTIDPAEFLTVLEEPSAAWAGVYGMELQLDVGGCNPAALRDAGVYRKWLKALVKAIGMKAHGKPLIVPFGEGSLFGITAVQLIQTSNINAHAANDDNSLFVNVFSCNPYSPAVAIAVTMSYFGTERSRFTERVTVRKAPEVPS